MGTLVTWDARNWRCLELGTLEPREAGDWGCWKMGRKLGTLEMGTGFAQCRKRRMLGTGEAGIWEAIKTGTLEVGEAG